MNSGHKAIGDSERRRYFRYTLPIEVTINTTVDEKISRPVDISEDGACVLSEHWFDEKDFVLFHFTGKEKTIFKDIRFSVLGCIVWVAPDYTSSHRYGVQFKFFNDPYSNQQYSMLQTLFNHVHTDSESAFRKGNTGLKKKEL